MSVLFLDSYSIGVTKCLFVIDVVDVVDLDFLSVKKYSLKFTRVI